MAKKTKSKKRSSRIDKTLSVRDLPTNVLEDNLRALEQGFPAAAEAIRNADLSGFRCLIGNNGKFRIGRRTDQGMHWLVDSDREAKNSETVIQEIDRRIQEGTTRIFLVAGFGAGRIALDVALKFTNGVPLFMIEPDANLMKATLTVVDRKDLLQFGFFNYAVGQDILQQAEDIFAKKHLYMVAELCLTFTDPELPTERRVPFIETMHRLHHMKEEQADRHDEKVRGFLAQQHPVKVDDIERVWIMEYSAQSQEYCRIQHHLANKLGEAIRKQGIVVSGPVFEKSHYYPPFYATHSLMEANPQLIMLVNSFSSDQAVMGKPFADRMQVPIVSWNMDAPVTSAHMLNSQGVTDREIFTSTDARWFDETKVMVPAIRDREIYPLHLAATYEQPGPVDEQWKCPVSYVGQVRYHERFHQLHQVGEREKELLELIVESLIEHRRLRFHEVIEAVPRLAEINRNNDLKEFFRRYYSLIIWEANSRYRVRTVAPLADLGLKVYGNEDWAKLTVNTPLIHCFMGKTVAHDDLPKLFRNSEININIHHLQSSTSLNQRCFDVPAAGGFLITDYMEGLEDVLEIDREVVVYRSPEELREKVIYYLDHPDERREIAERGRARVMRDHTFANRWDEIKEILRKEGW